MLNIVVPMAGRGSRFSAAGYAAPKPLISFGGKPMIQWVIENIRPARDHRFVFICLAEHLAAFAGITRTLRELAPGCEIVAVDEVTEGAACTVLLARALIDTPNPLMIANSDQFVDLPIDQYLLELDDRDADGLIMTFEANDPKWSYCRMGTDGLVAEVVEKQVVSNEATVGIYNFRRGCDFVAAADAMIAKNLRVNGEFYVAPTYNQLIASGGRVVIARTGKEYAGMFGLGIPSDLDFFRTTAEFEQGCLADADALTAEETVAILSRHYATCLSGGNLNGLEAILADSIELLACDGTTKRGRDAVMDAYVHSIASAASARMTADVLWSDGLHSAVSASFNGSGDPARQRHTLQWAANRITHVAWHISQF